jgi:hypothetical protein
LPFGVFRAVKVVLKARRNDIDEYLKLWNSGKQGVFESFAVENIGFALVPSVVSVRLTMHTA